MLLQMLLRSLDGFLWRHGTHLIAMLLAFRDRLFGLRPIVEDRDDIAGRVEHAKVDLSILEILILEHPGHSGLLSVQ
jgi:hypothetical protein